MPTAPLDRNAFDAALVDGVRSQMETSYVVLRAAEAAMFARLLDERGEALPGTFEERDCPICQTTATHAPLLVRAHGVSYVTCPECGLTYTRQVLTAEGERRWYEGGTAIAKAAGSIRTNPGYRLLETTKARYIVLKALNHLDRPPGRAIDIGAANGVMMRAALASGWQPSGIEANADYVAAAEALGLDMIQGLFPWDWPRHRDGFDTAFMIDVLEHARDPLGFLAELRRILVPGGLAVIQVPNLDSLAIRIQGARNNNFCIGHWSFFNAGSLDMVMRRSGFVGVESETIISEIDTISKADAAHVAQVFHQLTGRPGAEATTLTADTLHQARLGYKVLAFYRATGVV